MNLGANHPLARSVADAIRSGNVEALKRLLADNPSLAKATIGDPDHPKPAVRSLLHIVTDWPGNYPNGKATVAALIAAGADVNSRFIGAHNETPLHWAASCDDVEVLDALLDAGADMEAPGAVIGGGTPLADAVAFGQWRAARRLVERGARTTLWQAAALGLMERVEEHFAGGSADGLLHRSAQGVDESGPGLDPVTQAFWCACHGAQRESAEYLLRRGAQMNWVGYDRLTPLDAARRAGAKPLVEWLHEQGAKSAKELK